jgi:hypothetical protein
MLDRIRQDMIRRHRARIDCGAAAVVIDLPDGDQATAARMVLRRSDRPNFGGREEEYRLSFRLVSEDCPALTQGQIIEADGEFYRVLAVEHDSARIGVRIDCGEKFARD